MLERRIHLVRHGVTEWNQDGRFQGHIDVPLSELGRQQAAAAGERIARLPIAHCFASDLSRALLTARIIAERCDLDVEPDVDLREANKGELEGKRWDPATQMLGDESHYHNELDLNARPPGGESLMDVRERCRRFLVRLTEREPEISEGDFLIVGHGGTLRIMLAELLRFPPDASKAFRFDNCSLTTVQNRNGLPPLLVAYNDSMHLQRADVFWART
jgi:broad specificity phosphatase PhoE